MWSCKKHLSLYNVDDISTFNLADRANLYFKIGAFHQIAFNDTEDEFISRICSAETFTDVLEISQDLVAYAKKKKEENFEKNREATRKLRKDSNCVCFPSFFFIVHHSFFYFLCFCRFCFPFFQNYCNNNNT